VCEKSERNLFIAKLVCQNESGRSLKYWHHDFNFLFQSADFNAVIFESALGQLIWDRHLETRITKLLDSDGKIGAIDFFYVENPPQELLSALGLLLSENIEVRTKHQWQNLFPNFNIIHWSEFHLEDSPVIEIKDLRAIANRKMCHDYSLLSKESEWEYLVDRFYEASVIFKKNNQFIKCFRAVWQKRK
jgi:hypothetical protein